MLCDKLSILQLRKEIETPGTFKETIHFNSDRQTLEETKVMTLFDQKIIGQQTAKLKI